MSNLSAFPYIQERSQATPGLWNYPLSILSANIAAIDSNATINLSGATLSIGSSVSIGRDLWVKGALTVGTEPSTVTVTAVNIGVSSAVSDYLYLTDSSAAKSNYILGSRVGATADGLNLWDQSGATMIVSFSKQSVRFYQGVVGPVFDTGGALASTYNVATFGIASQSTETRIQAAINQAVIDGVQRVYLPTTFLQYNASVISFSKAVRMVREGGDWGVFDVIAYGATGNGNSDDQAAILSAASNANAQTNGGVVFFPNGPTGTGKYRLLSALTLNAMSNVAFIGQGGANASQIFMGANGASCLAFTGVCARILIRDLWLGSTSTRTSGYGLSVAGTVATHSDSFFVDRLTVQDVPSPINLQMLDNSAFKDVRHYQSLAVATADPILSVQSCAGVFFYHLDNIVTAGSLASSCYVVDYDCDTIVMTGCGALSGTGAGFHFTKTAGSTGPRLSRLEDCYSESNTSAGFRINAGRDVRLSGCHAAVNSGPGYTIEGGDSITISNSLALQNANHGFLVTGGSAPTGVSIIGCTSSNNGTATNSTYDGINVGNSVAHVRLLGNRCGDFIFATPPNQRYGISIGASGDYIQIVGNNCQGNTNAGNDFNFGTMGINCYFADKRVTTHGMSGDNGDGNLTLTVATDLAVQQFNTTLTSTRTVTINTSGAMVGAWYRIIRGSGSGGTFPLIIADSVPNSIKQLTGPSQWADVGWDGTSWKETAHGFLVNTQFTDGSAVAPGIAFVSETSLGWYRSVASTLVLSYGTLDLQRGLTSFGTSAFTTGTAINPSIAYASERSLGWFRSAASTMALSYGSLSVPAAAAQAVVAQFGLVDSVINYVFADGLRMSGENLSDTLYNGARAITITADGGNNINLNATSSPGLGFTQITATGESLSTGGSAIVPGWGFQSDRSLGLYRSGVSTMALSYGTLNLATQAVRLSMRTLAASSVTVSAANTNVAVNEVVFTIGGASGASLVISSGGTAYIFNSAASAILA